MLILLLAFSDGADSWPDLGSLTRVRRNEVGSSRACTETACASDPGEKKWRMAVEVTAWIWPCLSSEQSTKQAAPEMDSAP